MDPVQCERLVTDVAAEERTCPVCLEEIDRARVLDCGHCLCDTCASRYCRNLLGRRRATSTDAVNTIGPVPCPKCRDVTLVAMDADGAVGLPETGKLAALVAVCRGFVNNPGLFLEIEEDPRGDDSECEDAGGEGDIESRLQSRLQSAGAQLSQLSTEARTLREEIRAEAKAAAAAAAESGDTGDADEAPPKRCNDRWLIDRLTPSYSVRVGHLLGRQEAARMRLEAAWLRLRCLQFARHCYGNGFIGNFPTAWRAVGRHSPEVKRAADPAAWDSSALDLRRDSFVHWAVVARAAGGEYATAGSAESISAALAAAAPSGKCAGPGQLPGGGGGPPLVRSRLVWKVGQGGEGPLEFRWPVHANFVSEGRVAVCDKNNFRVQLLSVADGSWLAYLGSGCMKPRRILETKNGNFYICDETAACVKVYDKNLELIGRLGEGAFQCPSGIAETRNGNLVFTDLDHAFVLIVSPDTGEVVRKFHTRLPDDNYIPSPHFVTMDEDDFIVVSDSLNNTVKIFDPRGRISGRIRGFNCPRGLALDHLGNILVVNADTHSVSLFTCQGKHLQDVLCADDGLHFPMSAAFDKARHLLLLTQCSVYGRYEVLLFQLDYAFDADGNPTVTAA